MQQSTICPSVSRALRSHTWLCKNVDAVIEPFDAISCVDFAKPCLASQSSWARRANCGLLHYWLEPFNCWLLLLHFLPKSSSRSGTTDNFPYILFSWYGSIKWNKKLCYLSSCRFFFLALFCKAMSSFAKLLSMKVNFWLFVYRLEPLKFLRAQQQHTATIPNVGLISNQVIKG